MSGTAKTGSDGSITLPVPKTQEIDIKIDKTGYADISVRMDRSWGTYTWHQAGVSWQFPPENPKRSWETHGGNVQTDVDDADIMNLKVFLLRTPGEKVPEYGPIRLYEGQDANGNQKWTKTAAVVQSR